MSRVRDWNHLQELLVNRGNASLYDGVDNGPPMDLVVAAVRLHSEAIASELSGIDSTIESLAETMERSLDHLSLNLSYITTSIDKLTEAI